MAEPVEELSAKILRGRDAQVLLDHPLFKEAFLEMKKALIEEWVRCQTNQVEKKDRIHLMVKLTEKLHDFFTDILNTGKLSQHAVQYLESQREIDGIDQFANRY